MRPGNTEFLVTKAEASFMEESPNPKLNVDPRCHWYGGSTWTAVEKRTRNREANLAHALRGGREHF